MTPPRTDDAAELAFAGRHVDPVAIVQMQDGAGGYLGVGLDGFAVNGRGGEHANTHEGVGIVDLNADFGGADLRIEDGADVADDAGENAVGIGGEADVRLLAEMHGGEIVLVDIADDPDVGEIGDGEGVGGTASR